jgi:hypothetical protein
MELKVLHVQYVSINVCVQVSPTYQTDCLDTEMCKEDMRRLYA